MRVHVADLAVASGLASIALAGVVLVALGAGPPPPSEPTLDSAPAAQAPVQKPAPVHHDAHTASGEYGVDLLRVEPHGEWSWDAPERSDESTSWQLSATWRAADSAQELRALVARYRHSDRSLGRFGTTYSVTFRRIEECVKSSDVKALTRAMQREWIEEQETSPLRRPMTVRPTGPARYWASAALRGEVDVRKDWFSWGSGVGEGYTWMVTITQRGSDAWSETGSARAQEFLAAMRPTRSRGPGRPR